MPRYLIVRSFQVGEDRMPEVGRRSRELVEGPFPEITWEHSHVVVADDGHTIDELQEIAGDVTPADFPCVSLLM